MLNNEPRSKYDSLHIPEYAATPRSVNKKGLFYSYLFRGYIQFFRIFIQNGLFAVINSESDSAGSNMPYPPSDSACGHPDARTRLA